MTRALATCLFVPSTLLFPLPGGELSLVNATAPDLVLTEIAAANQSGLLDEDGEASDWIEVQNRSGATVDLAGWSLSDDPAVPDQWVFPSRPLGAGQFLVVFASGKDRRAPVGTNRFHTNFKLAASGEFLGLYAPEEPRVWGSGFTPDFPEQRNAYSYGLDPSGQLRYFATPTPGASNGPSTITGVAAPVHFSVGRGHFTQPFTLQLSTPTPGAQIRYTTNGSEPTLTNGLLYTAPLRVTNLTLLRAAAFRTHLLPSRVETHSYLFNLPADYRTLPVFSIVTDPQHLTGPRGIIGISNVAQQADGTWVPRDATGYHNPSQHGLAWERPTSVEYIRAEDNDGFQADCGIRVQGSDWQRPRTTAQSKFSFRLYFRGDYGPGRLNYPLFPLTRVREFDQLVLRAGFNEQGNPFIRDELTRRLSHDMGQAASHGDFAILLLNGVAYASAPQYNPCERVHEEMLQAHLGGSEEWDVVSPPWSIGAGAPGVVDGDRADFQSLVSYINSQPATNPTVYQEIARRLDLTNLVDYLLLNVYCAMGDWPANNFRAGRDRAPGTPGSPWRFIVWDAEWAMGLYSRPVNENTFALSGSGPYDGGLSSTAYSEIAQMYQRLYPSPEFRLLWADRIHRHFFNGGALTDTNLTARFTQMQTRLRGVIPSMLTDILTSWVPARRGIVFGHFNTYGLMASSNAPVFNPHGGRVARGFTLTMSAPAGGGTLYYTTNGGDPRVLFTGAVAGDARAYTGPLTLNQSVTLRARTRNGAAWSALTEAMFEVGALGVPLRITEIYYHPPDNKAFEFLELQNVGSSALHLGGLSLEGITFTFPAGVWLAPGARLVLASDDDPAAFTNRYPGVAVAGWFAGSLDNSGERLAIKDAAGNLITSVDYRDNGGWPAAAAGAGYSLEVIDPLGDPDDPANWRASAQAGGSPGATPAPPPAPVVRLNELMADNLSAVNHGGTFPDWLELHNTGGSTADLTGWSLSDDGNPRKFVFPAGTLLPPGGYLVVWCDALTNTTPGLHTGFALSRTGESLFLFDAATNRVDAVSFGLQLTDYSIGRAGDDWVLTLPTTNAPNVAAPLALPVNLSLNEWLANPPPGQPDWLELHNRTALPVALRGLFVSTSNAVHQITAWSFVAPGGFALLFADEGVGPDHLDLKLPAGGGMIALADAAAIELSRVIYPAQVEGVSRGRLPDGAANIVNFPGTASPGASNYAATYTGPVWSEVLARNVSAVTNAGRQPDFLELHNPNATAWDLGGMSVSVGAAEPGQWVFPPGTMLPGFGFLVLWGDGARPASTASGDFNLGRRLDGESGGAWLFNAAGQVVSLVEYGFQVRDLSMGVVSNQWRLLATPTPGASNSAPALLGSAGVLRFNEWMARPGRGPDWFELFNPTNRPADLSGLVLSDDPSMAGTNRFRVPPLSYIGPGGFVKWVADGDAGQGRNHVNFGLDAQGETLLLYATNGATLIDAVSFGAQRLGVSEGRLPDGAAQAVSFAGSASPGEANYALAPGVVISEVLTRAQGSFEQALELQNLTDGPLAVGGWYLSDSQDHLRKYRLPAGAVLPPGGFAVFYENQFSSGPDGFVLNPAREGEVWLSEADATGALTGARTGARLGPAASGVSFGRHSTQLGVEYVALTRPTFGVDNPASVEQFRLGAGASNAPPLVGPVVIHEIMYHPLEGTTGAGDEAFIELWNVTTAPVLLYDPAHPTNTWRLGGGVAFAFPATNAALPAGGYALVVGFNPATDPGTLASFRSRYAVPAGVPVCGPYAGKLDNAGERLELLKPEAPDAGWAPLVVVDRVDYGDAPPWPADMADGGGWSLQRRASVLYGNEPGHWLAAPPTAGRPNEAAVAPPQITQPPQSQAVAAALPASLSVVATGSGPLSYQWRFNGFELPGETNATLQLDYVLMEDEGDYDVFVSNPAGSTFSAPARLEVNAAPMILQPPTSVTSSTGSNVLFTVVASGSAPLHYQWRFNDADLPGAAGPSLLLANVNLPDVGTYTVVVSNRFGIASASATLQVIARPLFTLQPIGQTAVQGGTVALSVAAYGAPPINFRWRRSGTTLSNVLLVVTPTNSTLVLTNVQATNAGNYTVVATNLFGAVLSSNATLTVLADSDGDGLPDAWETGRPGFNPFDPADGAADADGDGMSNAAEYVAGTDYLDASSYLRADLAVAHPALLLLEAVSNRTYTLEYTDGLNPGQWRKLTDLLARTNTRLEGILDLTPATNRFYRVLTPMQR